MIRTWLVFIAALGVAGVGCKEEEPVVDGVGDYHLGKTQEKDVKQGRCTPQDNGLNWCAHLPRLKVAEQAADVHLYFQGHEPTAKLDEILLSINACKPDPVRMQFEKELGAPQESDSGRLIWRNKAAVIIAQLGLSDGRCELNFVSPKDDQRIADLTRPDESE